MSKVIRDVVFLHRVVNTLDLFIDTRFSSIIDYAVSYDGFYTVKLELESVGFNKFIFMYMYREFNMICVGVNSFDEYVFKEVNGLE